MVFKDLEQLILLNQLPKSNIFTFLQTQLLDMLFSNKAKENGIEFPDISCKSLI